MAKGRNLLVLLLESTPAAWVTAENAPNLHALGEEALSFEHHFTVAPSTFDAQYAVYYSELLRRTQLDFPRLYAGPPSDTSLFEVFHRAGYATAAFESSYLSFLHMRWLFEQKGLDQLTGAEDLLKGLKPGWSWGAYEELTVTALVEFLTAHRESPFLAVYNPISPHHPYSYPAEARAFPGDTREDDYRNALHYVDRNIGQVLEALRRLGLDDKTVVLAVSDHGEQVGQGHGFVFTTDELRVPCFLKVPGADARDRRETFTNHLDLAPTLAALFALPAAPGWLGRNLLAPKVQKRQLFIGSVFGERAGVVDDGFAYVLEAARAGEADLYRLDAGQFVAVPPSAFASGSLDTFHHEVSAYDSQLRFRQLKHALELRAAAAGWLLPGHDKKP